MLLNLDTIPPFYKNYVKQIDEPDMLQALRISGHRMLELVHSIPDNKADFAYAPGKWTVRELLCHIMDAERIFAYRALRFARNDKTPLSAFEENEYVPEANAHARTLQQLANEIGRLRETTIDLYKSFTPAMLLRKGSANNTEVSVLNLGFIIS